MSQAIMDPYSFAAGHLPTRTRDAIRAFWDTFAANANGLDRCFTSNMTDKSVDPVDVMASLRNVSPDLMWEFGPSTRGHALTITAEWNDDNRALARATHSMAPDLDRWEFHDVRAPDTALTADYFAARFNEPLLLNAIIPTLGQSGKIDLTGQGDGDPETLHHQTLKAASAILGEEIERDWVGFVDGAPNAKPGLMGRLRSQKPAEPFDPARFASSFRETIAQAKSAMPKQPYAAMPLDTRAVSLFDAADIHPQHPRADLITFSAMIQTYGYAILSGGRFSSRCHSLHDEWFLYLRIARSEAAPFNDITDRSNLEDRLHDALSRDGLGGIVAAGHGHAAVYIDIATTDVAQAVARIGQTLQGEVFAGDATLHFLDQGLQNLILPAAPDLTKPN